jgi:hypothetical protein
METLRRRVWQQQGVVSLAIEDITDPWLRQAVQNEAVRRPNGGCSTAISRRRSGKPTPRPEGRCSIAVRWIRWA